LRCAFCIFLLVIIPVFLHAENETEEVVAPVEESPEPSPGVPSPPEPPVEIRTNKEVEVKASRHLLVGGGVGLSQSFASFIGLGWGVLAFARFEYGKFSFGLAGETGLYNSKAAKLETSQHTIFFEQGQSVGYSCFGAAGGYRLLEWRSVAFDIGLGGGLAILSANSVSISRNFFIQALPELWYFPWPDVRFAVRTSLYYTFVNEPVIDGRKYALASVETVIDARFQLLAAYVIF
jgi:hypothetical protein